MSGWTKHWRSMWAHPVAEDRDRHYAWLWMLDHAAWEPTTRRIRHATHALDTGEVVASLGDIMRVTGCTKSKARKAVVKWLVDNGMISTRISHGQTIVTILNWDRYQAEKSGTARAPLGTQQRHGKEHSKGTAKPAPSLPTLEGRAQQGHAQGHGGGTAEARGGAHSIRREEGKKERRKKEDHENTISSQATLDAPQAVAPTVAPDPSTKVGRSRLYPVASQLERNAYPPAFDAFWRAYPRKTNKRGGYQAWRAVAITTTDAVTTMQAGAERFAAERRGEPARFTPHASSWINGRRWEDEGAPVAAAQDQGTFLHIATDEDEFA